MNASIGLIIYDELVHSGGYPNCANTTNWYIRTNVMSWTMSPNGYFQGSSSVFNIGKDAIGSSRIYTSGLTKYTLRPVINLKADVEVTGSGTSGDMWKVK